MTRIDRYLGRIILQYTLIVMLALLGLFAFANFIDQLGDLGKGGYSGRDALWYIALSAPRMTYELFPMAALLGTVIALSLLAGDSELIALRASGVSVPRITVAALKTGAAFVIAAVLVGELIAPHSEIRAQRGRAEAMQQRAGQQTNFGLWLRDADAYINIGEVLPDLTLRRVKLFEFDARRKLRKLVSASRGEFAGDYWTLHEVKQTRFIGGDDGDGGDDSAATAETAETVETARMETSAWRTSVTPQILSVFLLRPGQLSAWQLRDYIRHLADNRQQTAPFELAFWNKLMLPLSVAVMVALAVPFVFANLRGGGLGRSLFAGILLGLAFYAASRGFGYVALAHGLAPLLGAALPPAAFIALALAMLRRAG